MVAGLAYPRRTAVRDRDPFQLTLGLSLPGV
jgi:hypothetical protein